MFVNLVFYDLLPDDPESGPVISPVINTYHGESSNVPDNVSTLEIPEGTVIEDVRHWGVQNGQLVSVDFSVEDSDINDERTRRVVTGKDFDLSTYGYATPVWVTGDPVGQMNLMGLAFGAVLRNLLADPAFLARVQADATIEPFRDGHNVEHQLTALQLIMLWSHGAEYVSDMFKASWPLKATPTSQSELMNSVSWPTGV